MSDIPPFTGPRLKIARAAQHVATLRGEVDAYRARSPIYFLAEPAADPRYADYQVVVVDPVPWGWSPVIGDAVHNLRTALDLLASDVVRQNGASADGVYFPFASSAEQLELQIKNRKFHRASPEAVDLLRSFKPYVGGNDPLRAIHELDIQDKHQTLLPAIASVNWASGGVGAYLHTMKPGLIARGTVLIEAYLEHGLVIGRRTPAKFSLGFPHHGPFDSKEMIPTFEDLVQDFSRIVDAFETLCLDAVR